MKIGAQLYSVHPFTQTEADFDSTVKKIAGMGYLYVQVSGIGDIAADAVRKVCDRHGVRIIITHTDPERILNDTEAVIEDHGIMGAGYVGIGGIPDRYRGGLLSLNKFIDDYTPAAQKTRDAGMRLMYHNHNYEFLAYDGKLIIDRIAEGFPKELLGFTLDTYWVQAGGGDPAHYLKKFAGRVDTIHFKDMKMFMDPDGDIIQINSEVLDGNLNWPAIFGACAEAGVEYAFIEQDDEYMTDPFNSLKISYDNLVRRGII